ncbi:MAG: SRPBCC domain-containing protein [Devosia nanyangense]|uniref:SRPBCC domain-containing protein n=1 Tax=Devosia nanyangense TaxID=1228055 RepID=A0A933L6F3_9HYPH|nr:SRPBCC domain-containing protein [Devosia nanyangense]
MTARNFTTSFVVDQTPDEVFAAITNVRGWWSEEIDGRTDVLGAEFDYHFREVHRCRIKVTELVPGQRVAWRVLENHFSFTKDTSEWTGTDIVFDIAEHGGKDGGKTELRFTHIGLVPEYECYEVCANGWGTYIDLSLRSLITTGTGQPNLGEPMTDSERALTGRDYTLSFTVEQTPDEVFAAINDVRGWWTGEIDGDTATLGAAFTYRYEDLHRSTQKVIGLVPGKRVVWHVVDANLTFVADTAEWIGTDIVFDIARTGDQTELRFTHRGLVPDIECFKNCSDAWRFYIGASLREFIKSGKRQAA